MLDELSNWGFGRNVPVLDDGVIAAGEKVELVDAGVADEVDRAGVAAEAAEGVSGLGVEDLDEAGVGAGGDEAAVGAERGGCGGVGEGGDSGFGF